MAYLRKKDYALLIQDTQLAEITGGADAVRTTLEQSAQEQVASHLRQRWDVRDEFRDTLVFDMTSKYKAKQLVELNSPTYNPTATYNINGCATQAGNVYVCKANNTTGAFDATKWDLLGAQYSLLYIDVPYQEFDFNQKYFVGDFVWWKDRLYKCLIETPVIDHITALQFQQYQNIPAQNVFPDDKTLGSQYWQAGLTYSFTGWRTTNLPAPAAWSVLTAYNAGDRALYNGITYQSYTTNTGKTPGDDILNWAPIAWTAGDNRNQQLLVMILNIALYYMHHRISPKNVPELRLNNYNAALDWLDMVANGKVMVDLPQLQPAQGRRIRYGGNIKNINGY